MIHSKIAFDASILKSKGMDGLNRYTEELLRKFIENKSIDMVALTTRKDLKDNYHNRIQVLPQLLCEKGIKGNLSRLLWNQINLTKIIKKEKCNVYFSTLPEGMFFPTCKQYITIHDLLPLLYPETYPRQRYYFKYILPKILKNSTGIVTVSDSTKKDIEKYFKIDSVPIYVVYQGFNERVFYKRSPIEVLNVKKKYNIFNNYILCVGETRPYKNIRKLIEAFSRIKIPELKLVIVGNINKMDKDIVTMPYNLNIKDKVLFLGYVPDEDLASLYTSASAFVFPSLYEGFGIPLLEAMNCSCPIITSNTSSMPEVCGKAAYYVDPNNINSIAEGIFKVTTEPELAKHLVLNGQERIKDFNYDETANKLINIFREVL